MKKYKLDNTYSESRLGSNFLSELGSALSRGDLERCASS